MAAITKITLRITTGDRPNAEMSGHAYLGLAGREFHVNRADEEDFEQGIPTTYHFGVGANIDDAALNDPRTPWQLDSRDIARCPRYIRFEPGDGGDWNLEKVDLLVAFADGGSFSASRLANAQSGNPNLWLGQRIGKFLYFA